MSQLQSRLADYLAVRHRLGYALTDTGRCLRSFVVFAEGQRAKHITTELALRWATSFPSIQAATRAARLGMVRLFAAWCRTLDPATEIVPAGLLPHKYQRTRPYIYSDDEILRLLEACRLLSSKSGLRARAYATFFGLLAVTGMRVSEAASLARGDVSLEDGVLTLRRTKLGKTRLVPVDRSTLAVLRGYARRRDEIVGSPNNQSFFLSERGTPITGWGARYNFAKVSREVGLRASAGGNRHGRGPRLHDLRHRFAVHALLAWYRAGRDVDTEIPKLATYLGHVHVNDTYWYLEAVPELLELATARLEAQAREVTK